MSNCLFEALMEKTAENCSCTPDAIGFNLSTVSCYGEKIKCKDDIFSKYRISFESFPGPY